MASSLEILNAASIAFQRNPPSAILTVTTPQAAIASGAVPTANIAFDTTVSDNYAGHSNVTNNTRYVAQVAGTYWVRAAIAWTANATGSRTMQLAVSGTAVPYAQLQLPAAPAATNTVVEITSFVQMVVGDYLEVRGGQNTGSPLAILSTSAAGTVMQVEWAHA